MNFMSLVFSDNLCAAYVTEIVKSFRNLKPTSYLGRTALQKLTYFSKAVGVPIPCSFEIYNYGPYSEEVTRSVTALLADEAIQDSSTASKYSCYKPGFNAEEFSKNYIEEVRSYRSMIDSVVKVLGGSKPESLELVATLHFVNAQQKGRLGIRPAKSSVVEEFQSIKGDKFSEADIDFWYSWLERSHLL